MAKKALVQSACECQGRLYAELNESRNVLKGWAVDARRKRELLAPCHAMGVGSDYFQLGWLCPLCGRNTLRSFHVGSLTFREPTATGAEDAAWT
jgi:hypothetical protein